MATSGTRSAALVSAAIAIPIALIAGLVAFLVLHGQVNSDAAAAPSPSASASADTGPVPIPAPSLSAAHRQMCLAFVAALPTALRKTLPIRHVSAGPEQNAAFGTPPITAECGATEPAVSPTDEIYPISGVCWYAATAQSATVFTTLDRVVPVEITIPNTYSAPAQWANEFRNAIIVALPSKTTPYNC
jgi:hypothetical protein